MCLKRERINLVFLKVPTSAPFPTQSSTTSAESVLLEERGKKWFFTDLVVWQHFVMAHQWIEEILLSWSGTPGSWYPNYFSVLQALLVGNGSKFPPLSSAEGSLGIIRHFKAHPNSGHVQLFPSLGRNADILGWKQNPAGGNEYWVVLQNRESSHKHTLEIISLWQADELIQAVTTLFPSGVGCHCFPGPPDARLLLQNLSPFTAQWKEMFYALAFSRIPPVLFSAKVHSDSCLFLRPYCNSSRSFANKL